jgi:phosphocarrier protein HPr
MQEQTLVVHHQVGLHARPATLFAKAAQQFKAEIQIRNETRGVGPVNAKSVISLFKIAVAQNHTVHITAQGEDEEVALQTLVTLIEQNFHEAASA